MYSGSNMNRPCRPQSSISRQPQTRFAKRWPASRLLYAQRPTSSNCPRAQRTPTALGTRIVPALTNCSRAQKKQAYKLSLGTQIVSGHTNCPGLTYIRASKFSSGAQIAQFGLPVCLHAWLLGKLACWIACLFA